MLHYYAVDGIDHALRTGCMGGSLGCDCGAVAPEWSPRLLLRERAIGTCRKEGGKEGKSRHVGQFGCPTRSDHRAHVRLQIKHTGTTRALVTTSLRAVQHSHPSCSAAGERHL